MIQTHENLQIKKIGELKDICFEIHAYQRGYRWGEEHVSQMLKDFSLAIVDNQNKPANEQVSYYLQPVVLRDSGDSRYELIDGQQRLTTLWILCNSAIRMDRRLGKTMPHFTLSYQTKENNTEFLENLIDGKDLTPQSIDQENFLMAYKVINDYLKKLYEDENPDKWSIFFNFVIGRVQIIWYEVANREESGKELFMKINRGRIPLTNAELIKAYLLTHVTDGVSRFEEQEQRQIEIATQWDDMEQSFHDPSFWAFIAGTTEDDWLDKPRMEYFFDLMAPPEDNSHSDEYRVFYRYTEEIGKEKYRGDYIQTIWRKKIRAGYLKLKEWYEDRVLYHKIGYLIAVTENVVERKKFLNALLNQNIPKNKFNSELDNMIRESLDVTADKPISLDGLQYGKADDYRKLKKLLLLFNVLCCISPDANDDVDSDRKSDFVERYSFDRHYKCRWSLEHVNPQSEGVLVEGKRKIDIQDMVEWLKKHLYWLKIADDKQLYASAAAAVNNRGAALDGKIFFELRQRILSYFNKDFSDLENSICNLALLSHGQNASLGNDLFVEKRRQILNLISEGEFVPLCTRRLFLKFYSTEKERADMDEIANDSISKYNYVFWTRKDAENYRTALEKVLSPYLKSQEQ